MQVSAQAEARFWAKVDMSGGPDACWPWTASRDPSGYGGFKINGKKVNSHRLAYFLHNGKFAEHDTCHSCDFRPCCNPRHLSDGTRKQNMQDAIARNRLLRGEEIKSSKLSAIQVTEIRNLQTIGVSQRKLTKLFNLNKHTIADIVHRRTWKHIS